MSKLETTVSFLPQEKSINKIEIYSYIVTHGDVKEQDSDTCNNMSVRSLTPGQNPLWNLSGPTTVNYKNFPSLAGPIGGNCPSHTRLGAQPVCCSFLEGAAVRNSGNPGVSTLLV